MHTRTSQKTIINPVARLCRQEMVFLQEKNSKVSLMAEPSLGNQVSHLHGLYQVPGEN